MATDWRQLHAFELACAQHGRELAQKLLVLVLEYGELDDLSEREIGIVAQIADALTRFTDRTRAACERVPPRGADVAYPLRSNGLYRWRGGLYQALDLSSPDQPWRAMGLMGHPFRQQHDDINYVREDGTIIDVDFQPVGTIGDLEDTGEDA